ncbi:MAG: Fic family protein [Chitinophagaceae bacterium]|nr:Fic family protein [Chitinophagaceae bacterium]
MFYREYPHLLFKRNWVLTPTSQFLLGQCDALVKAINNTPIMPQHYQELMNVSLIKGAQATTAIEGNTLTDEDIKRLMEGEKMPPSKEYQEIEVRNILDAFNELLEEVIQKNEASLITPDLLRRFQKMVGKNLGEHFAAIPGQFRNSDVVVGTYRCPDHRDVPALVEELCNWLKKEFGYGNVKQTFSEVVVQAIVTHIYIEWIHPFGDGNGRVGRLLMVLQCLGEGYPPVIIENARKTDYYDVLEYAQRKSVNPFILFLVDEMKKTQELLKKYTGPLRQPHSRFKLIGNK